MVSRAIAMEKRVQGCLKVIVESIGVDGYLVDPIQGLRQGGVGSAPTIRRYLHALEKSGRVQIFRGRSGRAIVLRPLSREAAVASQATLACPTVVAPVNASSSPSTVVLVDLENVMRCYEVVQRASPSFKKLFEALVQEFGPIDKSDVFIPPYMGADGKLCQALHKAGFAAVVLCPMGHKDKDAVDANMAAAGRYYAREANAGTIVIVSEDADFAPLVNYVKSRGKVAATYCASGNPNLARDANTAGGAVDSLYNVLELQDAFRRSLFALGEGARGSCVAGDGPRMALLKRVGRAIYQMELRDGNNWRAVSHRSFQRVIAWVRNLHPGEAEPCVKAAFTALKNESVILQKESGQHKYYELTTKPALRRALELPVV